MVLADPEAGAVVEASVFSVAVDEGWPVPIDTVQVQGRSPEILQLLGDFVRRDWLQIGLGDVAHSRVAVRIGGEVMVDELAPIREYGRNDRVAHRRVRGISDHGSA